MVSPCNSASISTTFVHRNCRIVIGCAKGAPVPSALTLSQAGWPAELQFLARPRPQELPSPQVKHVCLSIRPSVTVRRSNSQTFHFYKCAGPTHLELNSDRRALSESQLVYVLRYVLTKQVHTCMAYLQVFDPEESGSVEVKLRLCDVPGVYVVCKLYLALRALIVQAGL